MKENQGAKLKIDQKITKKNKKVKANMPFVLCTCGAKILVVPDVAAMDRAVKNNIAEHKEADEQILIEQIFKAASKQAVP